MTRSSRGPVTLLPGVLPALCLLAGRADTPEGAPASPSAASRAPGPASGGSGGLRVEPVVSGLDRPGGGTGDRARSVVEVTMPPELDAVLRVTRS